ncbi:MAG TPA: class I SAM-dependent methyltransferase [Candidatus Krumholzibacteria bacterium]|nr:class I SAM-dependent methyltransferase [Candidatus Krumholzibacteria bacterium]
MGMRSDERSWWRAEGLLQVVKRTAGNQMYRHPALYSLLHRPTRLWDAPDAEQKNSATYCRQVFELLSDACPPVGRVLEIGPGASLGVARLFAQRGHETYALDKFPWHHSDHLEGLYEQLGVRGCVVDRCKGAAEAMPFPDGWFAFVYSNSVLEHVRDPLRVAREIARVLMPGGVTAHNVDVNDHRNYARPFEFLRVPAWAWEAMYSHKPSYQNRQRASQIATAFRENLPVVDIVPGRTLIADLGTPSRFCAPYSQMSAEELAVVNFFIVARSAE